MEIQNNNSCKKFCPKIVSIGGGTGLSTILRGLKMYTADVTAIVSVADDGGGSGLLRQELNMPPPGDVRNCLLALAETEPIMEKLLQYRFDTGSLAGQNFGNLFLAAMNEIFEGDFVTAVQNVSDVLKVKGKVLPVTGEDVELVAILKNGEIVIGESQIGHATETYNSPIKEVLLRSKTKEKEKIMAVEEVLSEISEADLITLGPGSLYTSVLPNLVIDGVAKAIIEAKAPVVYISNIMTQHGETDGYTAFDHVEAILRHTSKNFIDYCIVNNKKIDAPFISKYKSQEATEVFLDEDRFRAANIELVKR
ncbi:MAG: YvcK family protein, partial [Oscillospiraceae bacterium]